MFGLKSEITSKPLTYQRLWEISQVLTGLLHAWCNKKHNGLRHEAAKETPIIAKKGK